MASRDLERLLADGAWLRQLAKRLGRADDAEDAVQDTWMAVLRHPPDPGRPSRPWLATVLRHLLRRQDRERRRRAAREREATALTPAAVAPPSEGLERLELQHLLAGLVLELEEPFRSTVVQRYLEGQTGAQIAREAGVPEGTVRWRLNEALKRLRRGMDQRTRASWPSIVLAGGKGITMKVTTKSGLAAAIALLLVLLGVVLWLRTPTVSESGALSNASDVQSKGPHATSGAVPSDQVRQQSPAFRRSQPPRFQSAVTTGDAAPISPPGSPPARPAAAISVERWRDFTPDELAKLAENCELRVNVPGMHTINDVPMGWMNDRQLAAAGLHTIELHTVRGALGDYREALNQAVRRWHGAVAGDPDVARGVDFLDYTTGDHPAVQAMPAHISMHQISEGALRVALELAGRAPPEPPRDPKVAETAALYRRQLELARRFETTLAGAVGPARARVLLDGPLMGRTRRAGCM